MVIEHGTVVAVEQEGVWVEAVRKSVCAGCKARQGCGQGLLSKYSQHQGYLWILKSNVSTPVNPGDEIEFGLPDDVIVKSSMIIYLVPLVLLLVGVVAAHNLMPGDGPAVIGAFLGLITGGILTKMHARRVRSDLRYQPQLISVVRSTPVETESLAYVR
ncbi:MAG: SoxR reducing system RseC family protein [Cellvibrio sp.]